MKVRLIFLLLFSCLAVSANAQPQCATATCTGWADVNFVTCNGLDAVDEDPDPLVPTSDFAALQNAFCCLKAHGGTLVFPANGLCTHQKEISIKDADSAFHIDGNGAILRNVSSAPVSMSGFAGIRIQRSKNFSVRNLVLDGNRDARGTIVEKANHLLFLRGVEDAEIENVRAINSVADGFYLRSDDPTSAGQDLRRVRLIGCSSDNSWRHGLSIAAGEDVQILGGTFSNANGAINPLNGKYFSGGIRIETNPYDPMEPEEGDEDDAVHDVLIQGTFIHGNEAMGIHVREAPDQPVEDIRILGNGLSDNVRGQVQLHGRNLLVSDNTLEDLVYDANISDIAGILVKDGADEVVIQGNVFSDLDTDLLDVIATEDNVTGLTVRGNTFNDISSTVNDTSASAPTIVRTLSPGTVIEGNTFRNSDIRGILVSSPATDSVVADNSFYGMDRNVIYVNGEDTVIRGNRVADPPTPGAAGSGKAEAVVRVRSDLGTAVDNVIACETTSQRGYLFEKNPVLVIDNVAEGCSSSQWLTVEGSGTTHGELENYPYP